MIETSRRKFFMGLFGAPAIIAVDRLMPVKLVPREPYRFTPLLESFLGNSFVSVQSALPMIVGDGVHDDGPGIQAFLDGLEFIDKVGGFRTEIRDGTTFKRFGNGVFFTPKGLIGRRSPTLLDSGGSYRKVTKDEGEPQPCLKFR